MGIRPLDKLSLGDLLAQELLLANVGSPLDKIRHVAEACLLLAPDELDRISMTPKEYANLKIIHRLAQDIDNSSVFEYRLESGAINKLSVQVAWSFPISQSDKMLWWLPGISLTPYLQSKGDEETLKNKLANCTPTQRQYITSENLHITGYHSLVNLFVQTFILDIVQAMRKISGLVSADAYLRLTKSLRSERAT